MNYINYLSLKNTNSFLNVCFKSQYLLAISINNISSNLLLLKEEKAENRQVVRGEYTSQTGAFLFRVLNRHL